MRVKREHFAMFGMLAICVVYLLTPAYLAYVTSSTYPDIVADKKNVLTTVEGWDNARAMPGVVKRVSGNEYTVIFTDTVQIRVKVAYWIEGYTIGKVKPQEGGFGLLIYDEPTGNIILWISDGKVRSS